MDLLAPLPAATTQAEAVCQPLGGQLEAGLDAAERAKASRPSPTSTGTPWGCDGLPRAGLQARRLQPPKATGGSRFKWSYSAWASMSLSARSELKGITGLTVLPSGRLPLRSMVVNWSALA